MPPTPPAITVFMVGDKGAGKSTLTKALMTENKGISRLTARLTKVGGVTARTAGHRMPPNPQPTHWEHPSL